MLETSARLSLICKKANSEYPDGRHCGIEEDLSESIKKEAKLAPIYWLNNPCPKLETLAWWLPELTTRMGVSDYCFRKDFQ